MASPSTQPSLKTPLFDEHVALKAKMVPFGGWNMPVSYEGVLAEHKTVREACGLFDVSHMGEVRVKGPDSLTFLQELTINDVSKLGIGHGQYSAMLNEQGGMIDDLIIYRLARDEFFICVNASNAEKDFKWIHTQAKGFEVNVFNESAHWAQIAIQGPRSLETLLFVVGQAADQVKTLPYTHIMQTSLFGEKSLIARTGYTGEWGYEVYVPAKIARKVWMALLEHAPETGVKPIGLGARDTLRLEACYLLYGNDMNDTVSPLEAGISWATKLDKGDFIGRAALVKQKETGLKRKIVAFKMLEDGIPRHGMKIQATGGRTGEVTSGSVLPTLGGAGGMALVDATLGEGDEFEVDVRGTMKRAKVMKRPLYQAKVK